MLLCFRTHLGELRLIEKSVDKHPTKCTLNTRRGGILETLIYQYMK
jgi:hypothetical protein